MTLGCWASWADTPTDKNLTQNFYSLKLKTFPNPLHPNISMHILYTFSNLLTRRICLKIKSFFSW